MGDVMSVARVTRVGDLVVNIEVADQEWLDANANDPWFYFVPYSDELLGESVSPQPGVRYDTSSGEFEMGEV